MERVLPDLLRIEDCSQVNPQSESDDSVRKDSKHANDDEYFKGNMKHQEIKVDGRSSRREDGSCNKFLENSKTL